MAKLSKRDTYRFRDCLEALMEKEFQRALALAQRLLRKHPGDAETIALRGCARIRLGEVEPGIMDLQRAVRINPGLLGPCRDGAIRRKVLDAPVRTRPARSGARRAAGGAPPEADDPRPNQPHSQVRAADIDGLRTCLQNMSRILEQTSDAELSQAPALAAELQRLLLDPSGEDGGILLATLPGLSLPRMRPAATDGGDWEARIRELAEGRNDNLDMFDGAAEPVCECASIGIAQAGDAIPPSAWLDAGACTIAGVSLCVRELIKVAADAGERTAAETAAQPRRGPDHPALLRTLFQLSDYLLSGILCNEEYARLCSEHDFGGATGAEYAGAGAVRERRYLLQGREAFGSADGGRDAAMRADIQLLRQLAESGSAAAQCNYGLYLLEALGTDEARAAGLGLYARAAASGHAEAQRRLGMIHLVARGEGWGLWHAFWHLSCAAKQGDEPAQAALSELFPNRFVLGDLLL